MKVVKRAVAGTLESSDCMITIEPAESDEVNVEIDSIVMEQYGDAIRTTVESVIQEMNVTGAEIKIQDMGAYDCVIEARMETALMRASEGGK